MAIRINGNKVVSIEEKPENPKSNFAQTGCYVYDSRCFEIIRNLKPSARNEYEITDVTRWYMEKGEIEATILQDQWIDAGTFESLHKASVEVRERMLAAGTDGKAAGVQAAQAAVTAS